MSEPFVLVPVADLPAKNSSRQHVALSALIALVLVAGVAAAALEPSGSSKGSSAVILAASSKTKAAGSARFAATINVTANGVPGPVITLEGVTDPANKRTMITIRAAGSTSEVRLVDGLEYFHSDLAQLPDGKQWVQIDPNALGLPTSGAQAQSDPIDQLELLGGLKGDPTVVGHEQLDGVSVTHYSLSLDFGAILDKLAQGGTALGSDAFAKGLAQIRSLADLSHVPAEIWVDDEGRARQFTFSLHLAAKGNTVDEIATEKFTDFGVTADVGAPPADQVVPFSEVPDVFKNLTAN
jgi:hypothetical protein